MEADSIWTNTI